MFRKIILLLAVSSLIIVKLQSQTDNKILIPGQSSFPTLAAKTNLLHDLSTTINLGIETSLNDYLSLDLSVNYNPWTFSDNKKVKHILVQPELRYWIYEPFNGHYLGTHLIYSNYNVANMDLPLNIFPGLKNYRYQGNAFGFGLSYGYQWILSPRWNLEATFGFGYMYLDYTRYDCKTCGKKMGNGNKHYLGPTKAGISLIYIIK